MSAFRTLTATYLRRCIPWSLPIFGILILGPALVTRLVWTEAGTPELWSSEADTLLSSLQPLKFYVHFIYLILIAGGAIAWGPLPDFIHKARIGLLPVSNRFLGTFLWLLPSCVLMVVNLTIQHSYALLFRNSWPIVTTTICLGVLGTMLTALALWLRDLRLYKLPLVVAAIGGWGYWYALHLFPNGFRKPPVSWDTFSISDMIVLLAVAGVSWRLTVHAFTTYRRGEATFGKLLNQLNQPLYAISAGKQSDTVVLPQFNSAYSALLSLEWMKGRTIAMTTAGVISCFFCLLLLAGLNETQDAAAITVAFPIIGAVYGLLSGSCFGIGLWNTKIAQGEMKQFYATLPFTDAEFSRAVVKTCQRSVVLGSLILTATAFLTVIGYSLIAEPISWTQLLSLKASRNGLEDAGPAGGILFMLALPIAAWVVSGTISAVLAVGSPWGQLTVTFTVIIATTATILLPAFWGPWGQTIAATITTVCLPLAIIVGTAVLFAIAHNRDLIRPQDTIICGAIAATIVLGICMYAPASLAWKLILCSVSCLIVTPIAALPMAISSNRHR